VLREVVAKQRRALIVYGDGDVCFRRRHLVAVIVRKFLDPVNGAIRTDLSNADREQPIKESILRTGTSIAWQGIHCVYRDPNRFR
jgi:hypothetical protein